MLIFVFTWIAWCCFGGIAICWLIVCIVFVCSLFCVDFVCASDFCVLVVALIRLPAGGWFVWLEVVVGV